MRAAGRIEIGEENTHAAVRHSSARAVLLAADASENARRRAEGFLIGRRALLVPLPYTKQQLSEKLGKSGCSMAACTDFGLTAAFLSALAGGEEGGAYAGMAQEMRRRAEKASRRRDVKRKSGREHHE